MIPLEAIRAGKAVGGWLLRRWWLVPLVGLAVALHFTRGALADAQGSLSAERAGRKSDALLAAQAKATREAGWAADGRRAAEDYAARIAGRLPIIIRSTDTVRTYAQTPAGRADCMSIDRVRGVDALDADLFSDPAKASGGGVGAVPSDPDPATAGRSGIQR